MFKFLEVLCDECFPFVLVVNMRQEDLLRSLVANHMVASEDFIDAWSKMNISKNLLILKLLFYLTNLNPQISGSVLMRFIQESMSAIAGWPFRIFRN